jgi:hypothetical protein
MGDRGNIVMGTPEKPELYLYTHWSGTELPKTLQSALRRGKQRWDDPAYLARIIFCEMIKGDDEGITGFGISATLGDGSRQMLFVDCESHGGRVTLKGGKSWTFSEFCEIAIGDDWSALRGAKAPDDD